MLLPIEPGQPPYHCAKVLESRKPCTPSAQTQKLAGSGASGTVESKLEKDQRSPSDRYKLLP